MTPDWIITRIHVSYATRPGWRAYPFHVQGKNLNFDPPQFFSWQVPNLSDPRYDLSGAEWSGEARWYVERYGLENDRARAVVAVPDEAKERP